MGKRKLDLEDLFGEKPAPIQTRREGMPADAPSFETLLAGPWGRSRSRYLVQADADAATMRTLLPHVRGCNLGVATNVDAAAARPTVGRLVLESLGSGVPAYLDSGVYPRWVKGDDLPDFDRVFGAYDRATAAAGGSPDLLAVTAPDAIGDPVATRRLQRRYGPQILALVRNGVRVVVPVQGRGGRPLAQAMLEIERAWPGAWVGVPVRSRNTTPLFDLVLALVVLAKGRSRVDGPVLLPKMHLLGLGGSRRIEEHVLRIAAVYRLLSNPHLHGILAGRRREGWLADLFSAAADDDVQVARLLVEIPISGLAELARCVQFRSTFPCPPWSRDTFGGSHPAIDRMLGEEVWEAGMGGPRRSTEELLADERLLDLVYGGFDRWTYRITGRDDLTVAWVRAFEALGGDWTDACIPLAEEAEAGDPCMVPGAWSWQEAQYLLEDGGASRLETDASTVAVAAANGKWIVEGMQSGRTTPSWWRRQPRRYRFAWNLLATSRDRVRREARLNLRIPTGYDERGFRLRAPVASGPVPG